MIRLCFTLALVLGSPLQGSSAQAETADPDTCDRRSFSACGRAAGDAFEVSSGDTSSERPTGSGGVGRRTRPASPLRNEVRYVATCTGSGTDTGNILCNTALNSCPVAEQTRFWVYRRTVDTRILGDDPPFVQVTSPAFVCLGPQAPQVDPAVAVAGVVNRDFQRVVALKGVPEISPEPDTLVNIDTIFTTSSPESYDIPLTVLGQPVVITATASRWTWHFGDGATDSTTVAGSKGRLLHTYRQSGSRGAYVVIDWTGTFRIGGGPVQPVNGTATTIGDPVTVAVKQARTELVAE